MYQDTHALDCDQHQNKVMAISVPPHFRSILDPEGRTLLRTLVEMLAASVKSLLICFLTNVVTVKHTVSDIRGDTGNSAPFNSHVL